MSPQITTKTMATSAFGVRDSRGRLGDWVIAVRATSAEGVLQGNVAVFLGRVLLALVFDRPERLDQLAARFARQDDLVDEAARGRDIRVGELLPELGDLLRAQRRRIGGLLDLALVQNIDRALGPHDG